MADGIRQKKVVVVLYYNIYELKTELTIESRAKDIVQLFVFKTLVHELLKDTLDVTPKGSPMSSDLHPFIKSVSSGTKRKESMP